MKRMKASFMVRSSWRPPPSMSLSMSSYSAYSRTPFFIPAKKRNFSQRRGKSEGNRRFCVLSGRLTWGDGTRRSFSTNTSDNPAEPESASEEELEKDEILKKLEEEGFEGLKKVDGMGLDEAEEAAKEMLKKWEDEYDPEVEKKKVEIEKRITHLLEELDVLLRNLPDEEEPVLSKKDSILKADLFDSLLGMVDDLRKSELEGAKDKDEKEEINEWWDEWRDEAQGKTRKLRHDAKRAQMLEDLEKMGLDDD